MNMNMRKAVNEFDRTILSLNYNGYYTKAFTEVFTNVLGVIAIFRQHYENACEVDYRKLMHSYKLPESEVNKIIEFILAKREINKRENISFKEEYTESVLYPLCNDINNAINDIKDVRISVENADFNLQINLPDNAECTFNSIQEEISIKSIIRIPLVVRHSERTEKDKILHTLCNPLDNKESVHTGNPRCKYGKENGDLCKECTLKLCGVIEIISSKTVEEIQKIIGVLTYSKSSFLGRITNCFYMQEEPECYGSPDPSLKISLTVCSKCSVRDSCWIGYDIDNAKNFKPEDIHITQRMTPDEAIAQLFEKSRVIIDPEVKAKLAFLRYRADFRKFQYRGIHAMELDTVLADEAEKQVYEIHRDEINRWKKELQQKKQYKHTEICHDIIAGSLFKDIYDTESGVLVIYEDITFSCKSKLFKDRRLPELRDISSFEFRNGTPVHERELLEKLAFGHPLSVAMPTYYMGQLLGIIFVNFEPPKKWSLTDVYDFKRKFYRISEEFGIMLYHAITYDFISEIINTYSAGSLSIHRTILSNFFKIFNTCLCCFIPVSNNKNDLLPRIIETDSVFIGFNEISDKSCTVLKKSPFELNDVTKKDILYHYNGNLTRIYKLDNSLKSKDNYKFEIGSVYSRPLDAITLSNEKIGVESMLVMTIRDSELIEVGFGEGVYLFFFEKPNYVLQRHSLDLLREVSGILNVVMFGERRQLEVLNHARRAAVGAIMGRNMSHNIGSHVLYYHQKNLKANYSESKGINQIEEVRFMEYLKTRMDFIANVCTVDPSWFCNMDLYSDVLKPFIEQRILLNGIILSEGICRQCDECESGKTAFEHALIRFTIRLNGKEVKTRLNSGKYNISELDNAFAKKIMVAIPHSFVGVHAFYTILENFIRNSAKHSKYVEFSNNDVDAILAILNTNISDLNIITIKNELHKLCSPKITRSELLSKISAILKCNINQANATYGIDVRENHVQSIIKRGLGGTTSESKLNDYINMSVPVENSRNIFTDSAVNADVKKFKRLKEILNSTLNDVISYKDKDKVLLEIMKLYDESAFVGNDWDASWEGLFTTKFTVADFKKNTITADTTSEIIINDIVNAIIATDIVNNIRDNIDKVVLNVIISIDETKDDLIEITLSDNTKVENFKDVDESIHSKLINGLDATINHNGWGFKEQKISANYLRLGKISRIDENNYTPPDYYIGDRPLFTRDEAQLKMTLVFNVLKPKVAYFVVKDVAGNLEICDHNTISDSSKFIKDATNGIPHEFIIFEDESLKNELMSKVLTTSLPVRVLSFDDLLTIDSETINKYQVTKMELFNAWCNSVLHEGNHNYPKVIDTVKYEKIANNHDVPDALSQYILHDDHGNYHEMSASFMGYLPYRNNSPMSIFMSTFDNIYSGELIEIALSQIYVADERIWSEQIQKTSISTVEGIYKKHLWETMKINLVNIVNNGIEIKDIINKYRLLEKDPFRRLSFLVVHQGLIDKFDDRAKHIYKKCITKLVNAGVNYVITSGRGALKDKDMVNARFLEFATLESLLNNGDKLGLVKVLMSLRHKPRKGEDNA